MPNRPAKGASSQGRLHNIFQNLIGGMVNGASSNVGVDPNYSSVQGADEGTGEGTKTNMPYKATGLFGRKEAQERNLNNYQKGLDTGMDVASTKKKQENEAQIKLQIEEQLKQIGLKYLPQELALQQKNATEMGNNTMLQSAGIPALPGNLEDYQTNVTPNKINALQTGGIKATAENILGTDQANLKDTALNNTKSNFLRQAQAEAQGGEDTAMENLPIIPLRAAAEINSLDAQPKLSRAKLASESMFNVGPHGAIDLVTGKGITPQLTPTDLNALAKNKMMQFSMPEVFGKGNTNLNSNINPATINAPTMTTPKGYKQLKNEDIMILNGIQYVKDK